MIRMCMQTAIRITLLCLALFLLCGCSKPAEPESEVSPEESYDLPDRHANDLSPLKEEFFAEEFVDLNGEHITINDLVGNNIVVGMFTSFLTDDGQRSLVNLTNIQAGRSAQIISVFIPVESADIIRDAVVQESDGVLFLFRADGSQNYSLLDKYAGLFWDHDLIATDFPDDPPEHHYICPFYWVIDENGTIREKLIDYTNERSVFREEIEMVLNAMLGQPERAQTDAPEPESIDVSTAEPEGSLSGGEDVQD